MTPGAESDVIVIGAGLAGLSAAVALSGAGLSVQMLEQRPLIGGRAYSYPHPALGEIVDSQHVMLGCCTNLIDFCHQIGAEKHIRWYDEFTFLEPAARAGEEPRRSNIGRSDIPAPLHTSLSFLRAPMLGVNDKLRVAAGLAEFLKAVPEDDSESFAQWLVRTRQTERAYQHFWKPVVISGLNDVAERCSTRYAALLFQETFLKNAEGGRFGIPTQPLSEFYSAAIHQAERRGAAVRLRSGVRSLVRKPDGWCVVLASGEELHARAVVLAMPFDAAARAAQMMEAEEPAREQIQACASHFIHSPITSVHVWFDQPVTQLDHAVLLDTRVEWFFNKTRIRRDEPTGRIAGQYLELTISASFAELQKPRESIISQALAELAMFLPEVQHARVVKAGVTKEAKATFSVTSGLDPYRPAQQTRSPGMYLAGDWTRTNWPSTMEGAVRSGRLAAEAVSAQLGSAHTFLTPDLPAGALTKILRRVSR